MNLIAKVALVTGGSQGMGRRIVLRWTKKDLGIYK